MTDLIIDPSKAKKPPTMSVAINEAEKRVVVIFNGERFPLEAIDALRMAEGLARGAYKFMKLEELDNMGTKKE